MALCWRLMSSLLLLLWTICTCHGLIVETTISETCILHFQQNKSGVTTDAECGDQCNDKEINRGCSAWTEAKRSSCRHACHGTLDLLPPRELFCVMSCNYALNQYFQHLKDELGYPSTPALVADSLDSTSLSLEWNGVGQADTLYGIQWKYEEVPSSRWTYCCNQTMLPGTSRKIDNLVPYTKYRFRVAALVSNHSVFPQMVQFSEPSVVIGTKAAGLPASEPQMVRAVAVDSTHVSVTWLPGAFSRGPVLSYVLYLSELPSTSNQNPYSAVKDIPVVNNEEPKNYLWQNVPPGRDYSVSVAARNWEGEGPATTANVSTPTEPEVFSGENSQVLLCTEDAIYRLELDIIGDMTMTYKSRNKILGCAVHLRHKHIFFLDKSGSVFRLPLDDQSEPMLVVDRMALGFEPTSLSVDWLNEALYIVGEADQAKWCISKCLLDGQGLTVTLAGLHSKPRHLQVDPYNGYMFWIMSNEQGDDGLYRLDLTEPSNGVRHGTKPEVIIDNAKIGAYTVDHAGLRLFVADERQNTIFSVSLDGKEKSNIRQKTQEAEFKKVISLVAVNGLFFWTDGTHIKGEEHNPVDKLYFHHIFPHETPSKQFCMISLSEPSQRMPVPVNPPNSLQAIFGYNTAKLAWQAPHLVAGQGKGAWQNWSYEVQVTNKTDDSVSTIRNIPSTSLTLTQIQPFTNYIFRVGAYTTSGRGPWSSEFHGRSFRAPKPGQKEVTIVWGTEEGLVQTDTTGDNLETLVHSDLLRDLNSALFVTTVAWFKDMLYFSTNSSKTMWFNTTSKEHGLVAGVDSAGSIAVDWLGKRLYWSNPKQSLIKRCGLSGEDPEPLPIFEVAKEIHVDSLNAYIYWSTSYSVASSRLNGQNKTSYYSAQLFSGMQVMGITLDTERSVIFWIVRSNDGSMLYKAPMSLNNQIDVRPKIIEPEWATSIANPIVQGPLCYFSDHLLWLQDGNVAVISDTNGGGAAIISDSRLSGLYVVAIIDRSTQHHSNDEAEISVIPMPVDQSSINFSGATDNVSLNWNPVENVNYGKVFYEVKITNIISTTQYLYDTEYNWIHLGSIAPSYCPMRINIRAYTYWGSSPRETPITLYTPAAAPSAPQSPRVFVIMQRSSPVSTNVTVKVLFRWKPPLEPNGVIQSYRLKICKWFDPAENDKDCENIFLESHTFEYAMYHLDTYMQYNLQIWARTDAGEGKGSEFVWLDTSVDKPVPQLLVVKKDEIAVLDLDTSVTTYTIALRDSVSAVTYLASDELIFWLSKEGREISSCKINCSIPTKVHQLVNPGSNLMVDWVARKLYWSEQLITESQIWAMNLENEKASKLLVRPGAISGLQVSPLTNELFWVEDNGQDVKIMRSSLSSPDATTFLSNESSCNCPKSYMPGRPLALDVIERNLIWTDELKGEIWSTDLDGCKCGLLASKNMTNGLIVSSLSSDMENVYWLIARDGKAFRSSKTIISIKDSSLDESKNFSQVAEQGVSLITSIGSYLQPFPDPDCLKFTPDVQQVVPKLASSTSHSLTLLLPIWESTVGEESCSAASQAASHFDVYFYQTSCEEDKPSACYVQSLENCKYMETYETAVTIENLEPYSCYGVFLAARNHYTEISNEPPIFGSPLIFKTDEGAPSEAKDVRLQMLSPWSIRVSWSPPLYIRSRSIKYDVLWSTDGTGFTPRQFGELPVDSSEQYGSIYSAILDKLLPSQLYQIKVRAYSKMNHHLRSETPPTEVKTLPEPGDIELVNADTDTLSVSWDCALPESVAGYMKIRYSMQFAKLGGNFWQTINETSPGQFDARNLAPKSSYQFRLKLWYTDSGQPVTWPQDSRFSFETLVDRPSAPGLPLITYLPVGKHQVLWQPSKSNGADIEMYILEGKEVEQQRSASKTGATEGQWSRLYNGTENRWLGDLQQNTKYIFRVQAYNAYGYSNWSQVSSLFDTAESAKMSGGSANPMSGILSLGLPLLMALCLCTISLIAVFICVCPKRKSKRMPSPMVPISRHNPDVELATLRETPRGSSGLPVMQHTNALYISSYSLSESAGESTEDNLLSSGDLEIAALQHIRRDQIKLTCFLGSGAFGEVYEGEAIGLPGGQEKVAVKTLKKGATEHEKKEFLKEAQLMSNFRHEHILQMLGVCLDKESNFIVMELMEGGDLLNFLRTSRPLTRSGEMTMIDLVSMAVDVARGCRYLEEMRYVHRDLACRNCLVSFSGANRVVKIGDFGLARDVYKNDYYRKESEGLLPVRWMSPESLLDRVFTTQSDVWAFGVIMWEILTMGQQPYPARTNQEVFNYVTEGGRLNRPTNCPDEMHSLMVRCWHTSPKCRPTFKNCLDILEELKVKVEENPAPLAISDTLGDLSAVVGRCNLQHPAVVYLPPESKSSSAASTDTGKYLRVVTPSHSSEFDPTKDSDGYVTPCMLPSGLQSKLNRSLVVGEQSQEERLVTNCAVHNH